MKLIIVALALVAAVAALPASEKPQVEVVEQSYDRQPDGSYKSKTVLTDGSVREEEGTLKEALDEEGKPHTILYVRGKYSYPSQETGELEEITYNADENGYKAEGKSIPQA